MNKFDSDFEAFLTERGYNDAYQLSYTGGVPIYDEQGEFTDEYKAKIKWNVTMANSFRDADINAYLDYENLEYKKREARYVRVIRLIKHLRDEFIN